MSHIVVMGAGTGGMPAAYELRALLDKSHRVTVVNAVDDFQSVPSNPWLAVGWRKRDAITFPIRPHLETKGIDFVAQPVKRIDAEGKAVDLADGSRLDNDDLVITTGPKLALEEVPHAPCSGPAYEFAFIFNTDLKRRKLRHEAPITDVTSEPDVGHLGLGGVGDSKSMLESEFRNNDIKWITHTKVTRVGGLCNPRGFVPIDEFQRSRKYPNIFAADMGDTGAAFVALPQIPPRNVNWFKKGKWVHFAKVAFEKYFMYKMKNGSSEPIYEKHVLKLLGIERLER
jgi:sulfide:quinone oxidoreductase